MCAYEPLKEHTSALC